MNRREFLKGTLTAAALAPVAKLAAKAGADGNKTSDLAKGPQVTRRRYKNTSLTLPMLGFGMMRLPTLGPGSQEIELRLPFGTCTAKKCSWDTVTRCYPEYESVKKLADQAGMDFQTVYAAAKKLAAESI